MSYLDKILQPNETISAIGKKHWIIYAPGFALIVLAIIVVGGVTIAQQLILTGQVLAAIIGLLGLVALAREWFEQWTTEIVVTNLRVVYKTGFISRNTTEMNMEKIESVAVDQPLLGRLLDYGTIDVRGTGVGFEKLTRIAKPLALRNAVTAR